jgi:hypothetical protein
MPAEAHTVSNSMATVSDVFGDGVTSIGLWPARSPDLILCVFFLWGSLKVYKRNPQTLHVVEENILEKYP